VNKSACPNSKPKSVVSSSSSPSWPSTAGPPLVRKLLSPQPVSQYHALTAAALGLGAIPPRVFAAAFDLLGRDGWVAFTIKEDFLEESDPSGFALLLRRMLEDGVLGECARRRYRHRLSMTGEPLHYVAVVGRKRAEQRHALLEPDALHRHQFSDVPGGSGRVGS